MVLALGRASDAFLILRAQDVGIALALLPLPYVLSNLVFSAFSMPVGSLSDRIGHRNTFMIGIVLLSVVYMLFARAHSLVALWTLFALYGCAHAFLEGVGRAIVEALLEASETVGGERTVLEVIKNNVPAYNLFWDSGFREARELLVLRRPPGPPAAVTVGEARWLDRAEALALAEQRRAPESWITDVQSLAHVEQLMGVRLTLPDGSRGWIVFEHQRHGKYIVVLSRFALSTEQGNPITLGKALLAHVYQRFPDLDTHIENIAAGDPHLPALYAMGYVESFRRIEMQRLNGVGGRRADPAA